MRSGAGLVRVRWCPVRNGRLRVLVVEWWLSARAALAVSARRGQCIVRWWLCCHGAGVEAVAGESGTPALVLRRGDEQRCSAGDPGEFRADACAERPFGVVSGGRFR